MGKSEKILLSLNVFLFILQSFFEVGKVFFFLSSIFLSLYYIFAGYIIFDAVKPKFFRIFIGISLGLSIISLPFHIGLSQSVILQLLSIFNIALLLYLIFVRFYKKTSNKWDKNIFLRSLLTFLFVGFFAYMPADFKFYREIVKILNPGNERLIANLEMVDYGEKYQEFYKNDDCDKALVMADKAIDRGVFWLGFSLDGEGIFQEKNTDTSDYIVREVFKKSALKKELYQINGLFDFYYSASYCVADGYYNNYRPLKALDYYKKSNRVLEYFIADTSRHWNMEKVYLLNDMGKCYMNSKKQDKALYLFREALEKYKSMNDTIDAGAAFLTVNSAKSAFKNQNYEESEKILLGTEKLIEKSPKKKEYREDLLKTYRLLVEVYLGQDNLLKASTYLDKTLEKENRDNYNTCYSYFLRSILFHRQSLFNQSIASSTETLNCYKEQLSESHRNIGEIHYVLASTLLELGKYKEAKKELENGLKIVLLYSSKESVKYTTFLQLDATIDYRLGNYKQAEEKFQQVNYLYRKNGLENTFKYAKVNLKQGNLRLKYEDFSKAMKFKNQAWQVLKLNKKIESTLVIPLWNDFAYLEYAIGNMNKADSIYNKIIQRNQTLELKNQLSDAAALNGLGLIEISKQNLHLADSLFNESIQFHENIFKNDNPSIAQVWLNFGELKLKQGDYQTAIDYLQKSLTVSKKYFQPTHDKFGDIYKALGDVAKEKKTVSKCLYILQKSSKNLSL